VVKRNEKVVLNNLWKEVRFSKNLKIKDACQKTFVLLQAAIERKQIKDFSMRVEQSDIVKEMIGAQIKGKISKVELTDLR
jgi:hypothetical protein